MCMEFWNGWFDHWDRGHHVRDPHDAAQVLDDMLRCGASVNRYMAHGGTNFGLWSGANFDGGQHQPTVTSYDCDAPVGEAGGLTPKFHAFGEVIGRYAVVPAEPLPATPVPPEGGDLVLQGVADRALVWADGAPLGVVSRNDAIASLPLAPGPDAARTTIEIVVENQGRINFGPRLGERKGVDALRLGARFIHGWESIPLRLGDEDLIERLDVDSFASQAPAGPRGPVFAVATISVEAPADGFIALPGWTKGFVWINGFLLGRYWEIGPQATLYAPAPLWCAGENEIIVLELHTHGSSVELRAEQDLGGSGDS